MSQFLFFLLSCLTLAQSNVHNRFRRQYWVGTPYYGAQYYETQPQQWSSQYQISQNRDYYSPYFYGYQRQQVWQNPNQNAYQSLYNRPSWVAESSNGYATAPPDYNHQRGSYARPKYLATMQPKPTLSPVVLERSTFFVTQQPETTLETSTNGRHPTFLERLGVATLPIVPSSGSEEEGSEENSSEHAQLGNGELLPGRSNEGHSEEENTETTSASVTEEQISTVEPSVMEKDEIASSEIFGSAVSQSVATTEATVESTTAELETENTTIPEETTQETTTSPSSTTTTATTESSSSTTTTVPTTTSTAATTTTEAETTTTTQDIKPVTLLAFQEATDEIVSSSSNVTQSTVDQDTTGADSSVTGEGSGVVPTEEGRSTFSTGIVGLRSPPLPKTTDPEKVGLEVVEWTDNDNEVRKVLTQ